MRALILKARLAWRLGIINIWRVIWYRTRLKAGVHPVQRVRRDLPSSLFFRDPQMTSYLIPASHWDTESLYFGWWRQPLGDDPPEWHVNPFNGQYVTSSDEPWWKLSDFDAGVGDIKTVWEASRMDWVLAFAQRAAGGDRTALQRLNAWLADWCQHNPCFLGPNWKCGQEASIRVMHLLLAARFLNQLDSPEPGLVELVEAHLARIRPTLSYAIGQDNNHGTSEATALFIGGDWCAKQGVKAGGGWSNTGRCWLENRVRRLIEPDGGFSQHSVNYHRLMLETLSLAELWRRWFVLPAFSETFYQRAAAATVWLRAMVDLQTGDAPNLGANDGANLLPLTDADYRDYRPALQFASALFDRDQICLDRGLHQRHLDWLGLQTPKTARELISSPVFHTKGYIVMHNGPWKAVLRYPYYRFRPSHCDILHVDLWRAGANLLRDAGSYSYNIGSDLANHFSGPCGHNGIQFDHRDPMPKISRFLRGPWLEYEELVAPQITGGAQIAGVSYRDRMGAYHRREISLSEDGLRVIDQVDGFEERAVLRWRLLPGSWQLDGQRAICWIRNASEGGAARKHLVEIASNVEVLRLEIVTGWESRYYLQKQATSILEVEIGNPGQLITEYRVVL